MVVSHSSVNNTKSERWKKLSVNLLLSLHLLLRGWRSCFDFAPCQQEPIGSLSSFLAQQRHNSCRGEKERCVESRASWKKFTDSFVLWRITSIQCWTKRKCCSNWVVEDAGKHEEHGLEYYLGHICDDGSDLEFHSLWGLLTTLCHHLWYKWQLHLCSVSQ